MSKPHNKGKVKSILNVMRQLRANVHPTAIEGVREIGKGCQNTAYTWGDETVVIYRGVEITPQAFVIKKRVGGWNDGKFHPPVEIAQYGARMARTWKCGSWIVQERVTNTIKELHDKDRNHPAIKNWQELFHGVKTRHDMHANNVGIDNNGNLVVFDW